jgi:hypothetical protein
MARTRLAWLAKRVVRAGTPYLVTGPQAAFEYHRWLAPLENLVTLQVYEDDLSAWQPGAGDECRIFQAPPTAAQVRAAAEAIILDPTLEMERYRRRRTIGGLTFVAPEDLCLDLLARARGETSLGEAAAILVTQRGTLAWDLLLEQAGRRGLVRQLGALLDAINIETTAELAPPKIIRELGRRVDRMTQPLEPGVYPPGRHQTIPLSYQPIAERWGVRLVLPPYVIGKVVMDLQPQRS